MREAFISGTKFNVVLKKPSVIEINKIYRNIFFKKIKINTKKVMDEQKIKLLNEDRNNITDFAFCLRLQCGLACHYITGGCCGTEKGSI